MLTITVPDKEAFDDLNQEFIYLKGATLTLEHSLVSVSKWESKWKKPFLSPGDKTIPETIDYIRCMSMGQNVPAHVYDILTLDNLEQVKKYIADPMTATTFSASSGRGGSREIITSELIYYWMVAFTIPFECQKWHLNRLLTLIQICNIKNQPAKKTSKGELARRNRELNASRRASLNTAG